LVDPSHHDDETQTHTVLGEGAVVSHYVIVGKIGVGGMGEVYLARDPALDRTVALKFLSAQCLADGDSKKRFLREARAAAQLNHPNIITIHEVSEYQGRPYIAMEHVQGHCLGELIGKGPLPWPRLSEIATQLVEGLSAAHRAGIVHRDLKPANTMIGSEGRVEILDLRS
jgi:serine/threonine protein kinase